MKQTFALAITLLLTCPPLAGCQRQGPRGQEQERQARAIAVTKASERVQTAIDATIVPTEQAIHALLRRRVNALNAYNRQLEQLFYGIRNLTLYIRDEAFVEDDEEPTEFVRDVLTRVRALRESLEEVQTMAAGLQRDFRYPQSLARPADSLTVRMAETLSQLAAPISSIDGQALDASTARRATQQWRASAPWERLKESRALFNQWVGLTAVLSDAVADNPEVLLRPPSEQAANATIGHDAASP